MTRLKFGHDRREFVINEDGKVAVSDGIKAARVHTLWVDRHKAPKCDECDDPGLFVTYGDRALCYPHFEAESEAAIRKEAEGRVEARVERVLAARRLDPTHLVAAALIRDVRRALAAPEGAD